jgi:hypothetical protein
MEELTCPRCVTCGNPDVRTISEPVIEKARGTQLSMSTPT